MRRGVRTDARTGAWRAEGRGENALEDLEARWAQRLVDNVQGLRAQLAASQARDAVEQRRFAATREWCRELSGMLAEEQKQRGDGDDPNGALLLDLLEKDDADGTGAE